ncbi:MAG: hypothetical protein B6241_06435 [Spirochaetaceae bacterium 4572_59]|nr:MAG: hypothetical protein B6241_06435 [Spirochaetaceae bacterium 4572_59]
MSEVFKKLLLDPEHISSLLSWFDTHSIAYPWGDNPTAYRVWISEVMLQQTVVTAAVEHFKKWMIQFPDIDTLAAAEEQAVLKAWEGLGYYSRARNIHKAAAYLVHSHNSSLPESYDELIRVPGIGDYTARAVLSLAFAQPWPVLDANIRRIARRLYALSDWEKGDDRALIKMLERIIPHKASGNFNAALMQLGQQICRSGKPDCLFCPFLSVCKARKGGLEESIPPKKKRLIKEKQTVLFLIRHGDKILMIHRKSGIGRGLWFLPACEKSQAGDIRSRMESFWQEAGTLPNQTHFYTAWKDYLYTEVYETKFPESIPLKEFFNHREDRALWIALNDLENYPSPSVYRRLLNNYIN